MIKIEYLHYIKEIARSGSIRHAAENLYLSQPYLSQIVRDLENNIEIEVFRRTNKGVELTDAGREVLVYGEQIIKLSETINSLKNKYKEKKEKLVISSMPSFTMLDIFQKFLSERPDKYACINFEEIVNQSVAEHLIQGVSDVGLYYVSSENYDEETKKLKENGLIFKRLIEEPVYIVMSSKNSYASQKTIQIEQLDTLNYVVESIKVPNTTGLVENNPFPNIFMKHNNVNLKFNNNRSMLYYISKNEQCYCIGQKALNLTNPLVSSGSIKYIPIDNMKVSLITGYIVNENKKFSKLVKEFIDFLEKVFSNLKDTGEFLGEHYDV